MVKKSKLSKFGENVNETWRFLNMGKNGTPFWESAHDQRHPVIMVSPEDRLDCRWTEYLHNHMDRISTYSEIHSLVFWLSVHAYRCPISPHAPQDAVLQSHCLKIHHIIQCITLWYYILILQYSTRNWKYIILYNVLQYSTTYWKYILLHVYITLQYYKLKYIMLLFVCGKNW